MSSVSSTSVSCVPRSSCLSGQRVVVVGGGDGMGRGVVEAVLSCGGSVLAIGRSAGKLESLQSELMAKFSRSKDEVSIHAMDATDPKQVEQYFATIAKGSIHHLVVTAGVGGAGGAFLSSSLSDIQQQFSLKFFLACSVLLAAIPLLADNASVTLFSGALSRKPGKGNSALAATNAALETLAKGLALELGPKVRVNTISPGLTRTNVFAKEMSKDAQEKMFAGFGSAIPAGRAGEKEDFGHAAVFLMTNGWVTATTLDVDGGAVAR